MKIMQINSHDIEGKITAHPAIEFDQKQTNGFGAVLAFLRDVTPQLVCELELAHEKNLNDFVWSGNESYISYTQD